MQTWQFIADNPAQALAQVASELGPEAVVLSVRRLPATGMARLFPGRQQIEIVAGVPEADLPASLLAAACRPNTQATAKHGAACGRRSRWQTIDWLETMGLRPVFADQLQRELTAQVAVAPDRLETEWLLVRDALDSHWIKPSEFDQESPARPHVFIGPPGSGKTTVLCKWMTLVVLTEERSVGVWRLDGEQANVAEFLEVQCELLGVPVERFWRDLDSGFPVGRASSRAGLANDENESGSRVRSPHQSAEHAASSLQSPPPDLVFIDLPGVEAADAAGLAALRRQLATFPCPHVHLVLNAAYETPLLLAQWSAYSSLRTEDVIFTHLDEEPRRVKLWNLVLGTKCTIRFLSGGQKVPGDFRKAVPGLLFPSETGQ